jgi:hypothetical protein
MVVEILPEETPINHAFRLYQAQNILLFAAA